jgi:outer membrane protein TolC
VPQLNIGFDYIRHDGGGPDFNRGILTNPSTNFFYGGAGLYGPPLGTIDTANAIFLPLAARQNLDANHYDIQSAKNDAVLRTTDAYFSVHQNRGIYAGGLYTVGRARSVVARIAGLSADLAQPFEVDRARNMLADLEQQTVSARQNWRVESARLTRVLRLDPRSVVEPLERDHLQITLINPSKQLDELMTIALANRPELGSRKAMVNAAAINIRREKARPFLPNVVLNGFQTPFEELQAGIFGIGQNKSLNQWTGRDDISIQPLWQLDSLFLGNLARIKEARGRESLSIIDLYDAQDMIAEEVTMTHARVQSAAARLVQADRALRTGIITLNGTVEGLEQTNRFGDVLELVARPQEAVYALQLLMRAFSEYFVTVAEYNRSQFALFHALGYPAQELTVLRQPGSPIPVQLDRPAYLPPVGNGPPPATR